ncbi:unnamed protein product, partial [Mesorhabditis spiculigera]
MEDQDHIVNHLLAMAECLRTQENPKVKMAMKCVLSCFKLRMSPHLLAHCNLVYGRMLYYHTEQLQLAKEYLLQSYQMTANFDDIFKETHLQAFILICEICMAEQNFASIIPQMVAEIPGALAYPYLYHRLILLLTEMYTIQSRAEDAVRLLEMGRQNAPENSPLTLYYPLTVNLVKMKLNVMEGPDDQPPDIIKSICEMPRTHPAVPNLHLFARGTQLAYWLSRGQAKSAKGFLRDMQQESQVYANSELPEGFVWCMMDVITILTCVFTVAHSMTTCLLDKAQKYYGIATNHLKAMEMKHASKPYDASTARLLEKMRIILDELLCQMNIISCQPKKALLNIRCILEMSSRNRFLAEEFYPLTHLLLANYCIYNDDNSEAAARHFKLAVSGVKGQQTGIIAHLHAALFYLRTCRLRDYYAIADKVHLRCLEGQTPVIEILGYTLYMYHSYLFNRQNEFRSHVVHNLGATKKQDFFRFHSLVFPMFSTYFTGNPQNVHSSVCTLVWSKKMVDHALLLWTYLHIKDFVSETETVQGITLKETVESIEAASAALANSKVEARTDEHHQKLVNWFDGDPMNFLPRELL